MQMCRGHIEIDNACKQEQSQSLDDDDDDETHSMSDVHNHSLTYLIFVNFGKLPRYLALSEYTKELKIAKKIAKIGQNMPTLCVLFGKKGTDLKKYATACGGSGDKYQLCSMISFLCPWIFGVWISKGNVISHTNMNHLAFDRIVEKLILFYLHIKNPEMVIHSAL